MIRTHNCSGSIYCGWCEAARLTTENNELRAENDRLRHELSETQAELAHSTPDEAQP